MTDDINVSQQPAQTEPAEASPNDEAETETNEFIDDLQNRCVEFEEKYRRAMADYRNLERQMQEERKQYVRMANRNIIESLLEPLDFMETATKHIDDKGLQMVVERFYQVLSLEGLEEVAVKPGDEFNEQTMEAVETAQGDAGKVIDIRQKGFSLNGTVIRHARVVVGR